jgi:hypothetical protein
MEECETYLIVLPACQIAIRIGLSSRVYHDDVTSQCQLGTQSNRKIKKIHTQSNSREERSFTQACHEANHAEAYTTEADRQHTV